jgi:hypothetical protein
MMRTVSFFIGLVLFLSGSLGVRAEGATSAPDFQEVYNLVRSHLAGMSESNLNQAAVQGLVASLSPRVSIINPAAAAGSATNKALVSKSSCMEEDIAYVRIGQVAQGLDKAVREACTKLGASNRLAGVVLDLRYTGGNDYAAVVDTVNLFLKKERPLLDWGKGMVQSKEKTDALTLPVAVLVNQDTAAAAEALAAVVRQTGAGLILGRPTAGRAMIAQEFPLKNGEVLRIATAPIRLGDGSSLTAEGLKPDITVEVKPEAERAYYADAFQVVSNSNGMAGSALNATNALNGTNRLSRRSRFNEAELVRERKEGIGPEVDLASGRLASREEPPTVQDPALARALDLLKGLAVVRHSRS